MLGRFLAVALLGAAAPALGVAQPRTTPVERDSAGVRIVENPSRLRAPVVFALGPVPRLDLGGPPATEATRAHTFDHTQGYLRGVPLSDGGLAVIDVDRIHRFDARGARVRVAERPERGAGWIDYLTAVCRTRGDTVLVSDARTGLVGIVDEVGALVRFVRPRPPNRPASFDFCFGDGTFVARSTWRDTTAPIVSSIRLSRMRLDGTVAADLGEHRTREFDVVTQWEPAIAAAGNLLHLGGGETSEIRVLDADGRLVRIVRSDDPPVRITAEDVEFQLAGSIPNDVPPLERERQIAWLRTRPRPETWPAYGRIHVDARGRLWVGDYRSFRPAPDGWTVFDPAGRLIGRLVLPPPGPGERPLQVIGFGDDEVLVRRRGSDGGARLTWYPLVRAAPTR